MTPLRLGIAVVTAAVAQQAVTLPRVTFTDVTAAAGIHFQHTSGAFGRKYLPETMGSGVAFLDADGDGRQDLFLVNSTKWPGRPGPASYPALYRNRGDGTFVDQTRAAGLQIEMYGMGVASADFDNDGRADLYVTALGRNHLFRNAGGGRFVDVTDRAGVADPGFSTSAAWLDYDRDGFLDLFVAHYVEWSIDKDLFCTLDGTRKSYCTPESYHGQSPTLFHNTGHGTFDNVTRAAGVYDPDAKALGVALLDYDNDGWIDLFVANDRQPNRLYRNARNGTFSDVGLTAGVAFDETGTARAGMGVDAADYDGSGRDSIAIGNFSNEMMSLYTSEAHGLFIDRAPATAIGRSSLLKLTFGLFFFDYDLDGRPDLFAANGHVADDIASVQRNVTYAQPPDLYWNAGMRRFEDAGRVAGAGFQRPMVARGAAYADYDADGDLDLVITANNGPARLLRNDEGNRNNWLRVSAIGGPANRDAIGARLQVFIDGTPGPSARIKSGSSYGSQSELPLTFGLGRATKVSALKVTWPDGRVETVPTIDANQAITVQEGRGVIRTAGASK
ncbi:MAG TPA: CRTAC1 family protein [Vicinamibacterales bacterium]|nr:CRTAC1 family protein [Vicinamibacterales bacterium]